MKLFFLALVWLAQASLLADSYTMLDLHALKEKKQWKPLLEHLNDIPPSKRVVSWDSLAQLSVEKHFDELLISDTENKTISFLHKNLSLYPKLKQNKAFMQKRADFGLKYYEYCFSYNDEQCNKEFFNFVSQDPNPEFAFKMAKEVRRRMSDVKAAPYFNLAYNAIKGERCMDEDLAMAVESALILDPHRSEVKSAQKLAFGECHESLKPSIKKSVKNGKNGKINSCKLAIEHNSLNGIALKKCKSYLEK